MVTGLGGIFFTSDDPEKLKDWYGKHLGLLCDSHGHLFSWRYADDPDRTGHTQFSVFKSGDEYLKPSQRDFMINFRVDDLEAMIRHLKDEGMDVVGEIEQYPYGKFGWVMDPDGNKIELWEPSEDSFAENE